MTRTRVAVVGLGAIAVEHLDRLTTRDDVEVVGICDLSPTLGRAMAERYGVGVVTVEARELLDRVAPDAVHILTPPGSHRELVVSALTRGAHVLVEKPIATDAAAYAHMRSTAVESGRLLVENHNYLFTPALQVAAAEVGPAGRLGELVGLEVSFTGVMGGGYADPEVEHFAHRLPGGALRNFLTHPVSIAVGLLGPPEQVHAVRRRLDPAFPSDDEVRVLLGMPAAWASLGVSRHQRPPRFTVALEGTRGRAEVDVFGNTLVLDDGEDSAVAAATRDGLVRLRRAGTLLGRALSGRKDPFAGFGVLLDRFYGAARGEQPSPVPLEQLDAVVATVDAVLDREVSTCA